MRIGLMVEGQANLTWERWIHILHTAERLGLPSVFRSDHYVIGTPKSALDAYLSFAVAAIETSNIRFGPLVTPITFRSPQDVGRMAAQINQLSNGRFLLGLGTGWHEPEHVQFGMPFPPLRERFDRLEEGINIIKTLWGEGPASYEGRFYNVKDVDMLPKPVYGADTPILIGGKGERRTIPLVARYADEWNAVNILVDEYRQKVNVLADRCADLDRDPATVHRSVMCFPLVAGDERSLDRMTRWHMSMSGATGSPSAYREDKIVNSNMIIGLTNEVVDLIGEFAELGAEEMQFEHFNFGSDEWPEYLASEIAPQVAEL
ncbi:MAG: TIGR03560 family F420-dependent LLM class oxidoreductase [Dehalococcoidia bacterium]|jgi:F420-dependent oxidoreductase-like protein|nr:TIGR03560 family F420-dependent LLM class oxidoreductase [Dehalococcoidia bacterium]